MKKLLIGFLLGYVVCAMIRNYSTYARVHRFRVCSKALSVEDINRYKQGIRDNDWYPDQVQKQCASLLDMTRLERIVILFHDWSNE